MSDSSRRCFIHVGLPKTGTSYLQSVFFGSGPALSDQGVALLPRARGDHLNLALVIRDIVGPFDHARVHGALDRLARQLGRTSATTVLITQEGLAPTRTEQAARLLQVLDGWEVHVVVTARDLARQVPSAWQQRIQNRLHGGIEEFFDAVVTRGPMAADFWANHDLPVVVEQWGTAVGRERVHVVTCPPQGAGSEELLTRFCRVLGVDPTTLSTDQPTGNTALGRPQAELQRRVNIALGERFPHSRAGYLRVGQAFLAGKVLRAQGGRPALLPASLRPWAEETAEQWRTALRAGAYDVVGDLDDLLPRDTAFEPSIPAVGDAELVDVAARALADILEIRDRELDETAGLRRRLAELEDRLREARTAPASPTRWLIAGRSPRQLALGVRRRLAPRRT